MTIGQAADDCLGLSKGEVAAPISPRLGLLVAGDAAMSAAERLLRDEAEALRGGGNAEAPIFLSLATGDVEPVVRKAIANGTLTERLVSMN